MNVSFREITTTEVEVKSLKELAELIKADIYGFFELEPRYRFNTNEPYVVYFARNIENQDDDYRYSCTISWELTNEIIKDGQEPSQPVTRAALGLHESYDKVFDRARKYTEEH